MTEILAPVVGAVTLKQPANLAADFIVGLFTAAREAYDAQPGETPEEVANRPWFVARRRLPNGVVVDERDTDINRVSVSADARTDRYDAIGLYPSLTESLEAAPAKALGTAPKTEVKEP